MKDNMFTAAKAQLLCKDNREKALKKLIDNTVSDIKKACERGKDSGIFEVPEYCVNEFKKYFENLGYTVSPYSSFVYTQTISWK